MKMWIELDDYAINFDFVYFIEKLDLGSEYLSRRYLIQLIYEREVVPHEIRFDSKDERDVMYNYLISTLTKANK